MSIQYRNFLVIYKQYLHILQRICKYCEYSWFIGRASQSNI